MKNILNKILFFTLPALLFSCQKIIDIDPISNVGADAFYRNSDEVGTAMTGCYNGLHGPLYNEWMFTELRSDNVLQGVPNSSSAQNIELNELDMFMLNPSHDKVYEYWLATYKNLRAINYVLRSLGVQYSGGQITVGTGTAQLNTEQKNQFVGEALFLRAYHYFNLVRLWGSVFLITDPVDPQKAKQVQRSSVDDLYTFIIADLRKAVEVLPEISFSQISSANFGKANLWAAKGLLAKVYLTRNQKSEALTQLNDIINNSGYGLLSSYSDVFSIGNEMNREIIFAVRYKGGGFGLGSPFANLFAPTGSGKEVVNNDGNGFDFPTTSAMTMYKTPATTTGVDTRKAVTVAQYTAAKPYVKKFLSQVVLRYDAENDWPVLRYTDILLMKAEATGYDGVSGSSVGLINQIRQRAGALEYQGDGDFETVFYRYPASGDFSIGSSEDFTAALLEERRLELAFENHRYFDMIRLGDAVQMLKDHFAEEYASHYSEIRPVISLATLQQLVTGNKLLLPIPQREIDTNDQIDIGQNPGY